MNRHLRKRYNSFNREITLSVNGDEGGVVQQQQKTETNTIQNSMSLRLKQCTNLNN